MLRVPALWLGDKSSDVPGSLGFDAGLLQKAEVTKPFDEPVLPGSKRDAVAVGQAAGHAASVAQGVEKVKRYVTLLRDQEHLDDARRMLNTGQIINPRRGRRRQLAEELNGGAEDK